MIIGLVIAIPLGWIAARYKWALSPADQHRRPDLHDPLAGPVRGDARILGTQILDVLNVVIALAAYAVALLVRVVADGLASVPFEAKQAATAMGYKPLGRFFAVELPLAVPVIAAGVRVATVSNVSLVTVATLIGTSQLGTLFSDGSRPAPTRAARSCWASCCASCWRSCWTSRSSSPPGQLTPWLRAVPKS